MWETFYCVEAIFRAKGNISFTVYLQSTRSDYPIFIEGQITTRDFKNHSNFCRFKGVKLVCGAYILWTEMATCVSPKIDERKFHGLTNLFSPIICVVQPCFCISSAIVGYCRGSPLGLHGEKFECCVPVWILYLPNRQKGWFNSHKVCKCEEIQIQKQVLKSHRSSVLISTPQSYLRVQTNSSDRVS